MGHTSRAADAALTKLVGRLKCKLYGDVGTDVAVIEAARNVVGDETYIVGDVNGGYRRKQSEDSVAAIAAALVDLHAAGLTACEDPAYMTPSQWAEVQRLVGGLDLLPDVPVRPAWKAARQINPNMGRVFNMHPACMGSAIEVVTLGRMIQGWGKRLMVGDSSLVGPACPAWQQIAIGLGADWVEAVEKPQENDVYQRCRTAAPTGRTPDGLFAYEAERPGFGTDLDADALHELSLATVTL
ncbi:MAG: enolase C-terminal domain-like protein [Planctomycetota bacterium]